MENSAAYTYSPTDGRISQISNLLPTVSGPIHTVTNTWETNRDALDLKQNKVGISVISSCRDILNVIGQRTGLIRMLLCESVRSDPIY